MTTATRGILCVGEWARRTFASPARLRSLQEGSAPEQRGFLRKKNG